jgi:CheY-like chemotaxis protein
MDTVLIVDDSVMLINYLEESFREYQDSFSIITANDGLEAIEILKNHSISLLITDLQMPKIDGLGLLAYANKYYPNLPCIVMSAHGTPKIIETIQRDILQFIEKPFTAKKLAWTIMAALKRDDPDGSLSGISVVSFLQMVEMEQKTCLCEVEAPGSPKGFFYFKGGELFHAVCGKLKGEEAAIHLINLENPTINFRRPPQRKIARAIKREMTGLILEATRIKDESKQK